MEDERRIIFDARLAAFDGRQFWEIIFQHRARGGFFNLHLYLLPPFFSANRFEDIGGIDVLIPALKHSHLREVVHVFAITFDAMELHLAGLSYVVAVMLSRDDTTRRD